MSEKANNSEHIIESSSPKEELFIDKIDDIFSLNKIFNAVGIIGTVMNIWYFVDTLYQMRTGEVSLGLYIHCFIVIFLFLLFISLSKFKLDDDNAFVIFMSSSYGIVLTLILIATYYITAEVVFLYGADFPPNTISSDGPNLSEFTQSRSALAIFMYLSAFAGSTYFLHRSHKIVGKIATLPIFILFIWIAFRLIGSGEILNEFKNGFKDEYIFGYVTITVMSLMLIRLASTILKRSES